MASKPYVHTNKLTGIACGRTELVQPFRRAHSSKSAKVEFDSQAFFEESTGQKSSLLYIKDVLREYQDQTNFPNLALFRCFCRGAMMNAYNASQELPSHPRMRMCNMGMSELFTLTVARPYRLRSSLLLARSVERKRKAWVIDASSGGSSCHKG